MMEAEGTAPETGQENKRTCDHCGNEYTFKSPKSRFCSERCRNRAVFARKKEKLNGTAMDADSRPGKSGHHDDDHRPDDFTYDKSDRSSSTKLVGSLRGLDAQSQYIITHQRDMINDLKTERSRLQQKVDQLTDKNKDLEKKLDRVELEQSFDTASKSGLNGISNNPVVQTLVQHAAPALGEWLMKFAKAAPGPDQLTGGASSDPEVQRQIMEINAWYGQQPKETQVVVYEILDGFAKTEPDQLPGILKQIIFILNGTSNGTSINKQYTGTWN